MIAGNEQVPDGYFNAEQVRFLNQMASVMAVTVETMHLFEASRAMSQRLLKAQDEERMILASQIHEGPLQQISMAAGHSVHQGLKACANQLREICAGLYPRARHEKIDWMVSDVVYNFQQKTPLKVNLFIHIPDELTVPTDIKRSFYYVLVEALNNVEKHAMAGEVTVSLTYQAERLTLSIQDNGKGSTLTLLSLSDLFRARHFGVVGMYEWAGVVDGTLVIQDHDKGGMLVTVSVSC